jgi:hypothetical protein
MSVLRKKDVSDQMMSLKKKSVTRRLSERRRHAIATRIVDVRIAATVAATVAANNSRRPPPAARLPAARRARAAMLRLALLAACLLAAAPAARAKCSTNCYRCDSTGCLDCRAGYSTFDPEAGDFGTTCRSCVGKSWCEKCERGYGLASKGATACTRCKVANCVRCSVEKGDGTLPGRCSECKDGERGRL